MEITNFFKELFEYNLHCNRELIALFKNNESQISENALKLLNHTLNAHQIINERICGKDLTCSVWEIRPPETLEAINQNNHATSLHLLKTTDLEKIIEYKTSKGFALTNSVRDMLFHIVNHSTYHRAQIASDIKLSGIQPLPTDYMIYKNK
ncbi:MAG TPA: DinB family protein [Patescibacteria group bacterium]|nr:DinB family protein [Patescibacteria group bacterium]